MKLVDMKLKELLQEVASSSPAPGGGSVSALLGAFGTALAEMVCQITLNKKKYETVWNDMEKYLKQLKSIREELERIVDLDADAFNDVVTAYKLPKETEEEKSARRHAIIHATEKAIRVPLKTMELSLKSLEIFPFIGEKGHPSSISDVGVAAISAYGAIKGAYLNVKINALDLSGMNETQKSSEFVSTAQQILSRAEEKFNETIAIVESKLKG